MAPGKEVEPLIFGFHAVEEALRQGRAVGTLLLARGRKDARRSRIEELARSQGAKVRIVDPRQIERLLPGQAHQGVAVTVEVRRPLALEDFLELCRSRSSLLAVVLDGVQDPRNLGAVIRHAALCGADAVIVPRDRAAGLTPAALKVASGGAEHVELVKVGNLATALRRMKAEGVWIVGADAGGPVQVQELEFPAKAAVVVGEEHRGLRRLTREECDYLVRIPSTDKLDSFNVSFAAGLFLFFGFLARTAPSSR